MLFEPPKNAKLQNRELLPHVQCIQGQYVETTCMLHVMYVVYT